MHLSMRAYSIPLRMTLIMMTTFGFGSWASDSILASAAKLPTHRIEVALNSVLNSPKFGPIDIGVEEAVASELALPAYLTSAFKNVTEQLGLLGHQFTLSSYRDLGGVAYCDVQKMNVRVDVEMAERMFESVDAKARQMAFEFIFAHEISHYIQAYYADKISADGSTPSGYIFRDVGQSFESENPVPQEVVREFLRKVGSLIYARHVEVDVFAILILRRMGKNIAEVKKSFHVAQRSFFDSESDMSFDLDRVTAVNLQEAFSALEGQFRIRSIQQSFPELR